MGTSTMDQLSPHKAEVFVQKWKNASSEKSDGQSFWRDFFIDVCELKNLKESGIEFERPVVSSKKGNTNYIDVFWKDTLLIEQKSLGKNLDEAENQARGYVVSLPPALRPPVIVVSDFSRIRIVEYLINKSFEFGIEDLAKNLHRIEAIISQKGKDVTVVEIEADQKASRLMAKLYKQLEVNGYEGHEASVFMVRILFCLFADDTRMWQSGLFSSFLNDTVPDGKDTGARIQSLFEILDTPVDLRPKVIDEALQNFPYVNGGLFSERLSTFYFNSEMRKALLDACAYDWSSINPTIFGALFQAIKSKEERRALGEHYTSENAIDKALQPLFLDQLNEKIIDAWDNPAKLKSIKSELGIIQILDPACGSGNFLITAYKRLRRLELDIIQRLKQLDGTANQVGLLDGTLELAVSLEQLHGIEIEEWSSQIATVALFLTDHQENLKLETVIGYAPNRFPLSQKANIIHANSLTTNWSELMEINDNTIIVGNPPFLGSTYQTKSQKLETKEIWGKSAGVGTLDYVTNWYLLAAQYLEGKKGKFAFVSTNSIVQGVQPAVWVQRVMDLGWEISFCHQTFAWESDAAGKAGVHTVIIGFSPVGQEKKKIIFEYENPSSAPQRVFASQINGYLLDAPNVLVSAKAKPIQSFVPEMVNGSKPADGGFISNLSEDEAELIKQSDSVAAKYLRPIVGAQELINGSYRYCLWLKEASPVEMKNSKVISEKISKVRSMREASSDKATKADANRPSEFQTDRQPKSDYLAIPATSSENREYVPMKLLQSSVIATNALLTIPNADYAMFALLESKVFAAWSATVSGRLESRLRLSAEITYNNFPFVELNADQKTQMMTLGKEIELAREKFPDSNLATLYDANTMPNELRKIHKENDKAVLAIYGLKPNATNAEILTKLFEMYSALIEDAKPLTIK